MRRALEPTTVSNYQHIRVTPLTGALGAEVGGVDLRDVDDDTFAELSDAWLRHKVLFYRHQHDLTRADHVAFGNRWGELEVHPFAPKEADHPEIIVIDSTPERFYAAAGWHSDVSFRECPPMGSILRGVVIPPLGGDTLWANMELAYDRLADDLKEQIEGRFGIHSFVKTFGQRLSEEDRQSKLEEHPEQRHPLVRTHPVTGKRSLFANEPFCVGIEGMEPDESQALLDRLYAEATFPEYQCRFRWAEGSLAQWDNRCTQHYASPDYAGHRRRVERVTMIGDKPI